MNEPEDVNIFTEGLGSMEAIQRAKEYANRTSEDQQIDDLLSYKPSFEGVEEGLEDE